MANNALDNGKLDETQRIYPVCIPYRRHSFLFSETSNVEQSQLWSLLLALVSLISSVFATLNSILLSFKALNSRLPSSFNPLHHFQKQKQQQRLLGGRGNHLIDRGLPSNYNRELAKHFSLQVPNQQKQQSPFGKELPPLKPTVEPINRTEGPSFVAAAETDEASTMPVTKFTKAGLGAKYNKSDKTYSVPKDSFIDCLVEIKSLQDENGELVARVEELEQEVADLEALAKKKPNSSKSSRKIEQNEDVVKAVSEFVRDVLFRNVKFAPPGDKLKAACGMVWAGIKDKLKLDKGPRPLSELDFEEIYGSAVLTALSGRRQYVQTRSEIAAKGKKSCVLHFGFCLIYTKWALNFIVPSNLPQEWFDKHKNLPTLEEIEKVWELNPPGEAPSDSATPEEKAKHVEDAAKHEKELELLTWYLDSFLPNAVGLEFWGPNVRPFRLMTDKFDVPGDPSGKKKVLVTITSEAFALVIFANCRDKWVADFKLKAGNKRAKIPKFNKDDPETHKYQNKWSSSRTGQVQGGGWDYEALQYLNKSIAAIQTWRKAEAERGNDTYKLGQDLIRKAQELTMVGQEPKTKKRKQSAEKAEAEVVAIDLTILDE